MRLHTWTQRFIRDFTFGGVGGLTGGVSSLALTVTDSSSREYLLKIGGLHSLGGMDETLPGRIRVVRRPTRHPTNYKKTDVI